MSTTVKHLGFIPKNRGTYASGTRYYKDNIVQYHGSSYVASPTASVNDGNAGTQQEPLYYLTRVPFDDGSLSAGWEVFASGNNVFSTGESVTEVGIDEEPTAGSDNLVNSGGVAEKILRNNLVTGNLAWTRGKYINNSGGVSNGENYEATLNFYPVLAGEVINAKCRVGDDNTAIVVYAMDKSTVAAYYNDGDNFEITISANGYIRFCNRFASQTPIIYIVGKESSSTNKSYEDIKNIQTDLTGVYTTEDSTIYTVNRNSLESGNILFSPKCRIKSDGTVDNVGDTTLYGTKTYYPVKNGDVVKCNLRAQGNSYIATYNSDKTLRQAYQTTDNALTLNIDFDGYIRFSNQRVSYGVMKELVYLDGIDNLNEIAKNGTAVAQEANTIAISYKTDGTKDVVATGASQVGRTLYLDTDRKYQMGETGVITVETDGQDFYSIFLLDSAKNQVQQIAYTSPGSYKGNNVFMFTVTTDAAVIVRLYIYNAAYAGSYKVTCLSSDRAIAYIADNKAGKTPFLPLWAQNGKERILSFLRSKTAHKIDVIGFHTDQHISATNPTTNYYPIARGLKVLSDLASEFPFNLVCLGGDEPLSASSDNTIDTVIKDMNDVVSLITAPNTPIVAMAGNHDAGQNYSYVGSDGYMEYNTKTKKAVSAGFLDGYGTRSTNCYFDDEGSQVRYLFLDAWSKNQAEMPTIIAEALSDNKLKNSDWRVIIFSHNVIPSGLTGNNYNPIDSMSGYSGTWASIKSYMDEGVNVVVCFNGHGHCDQQDVKDGVLFIATNSACNNNEPSFDGITYAKPANTPKETAFDVFVIDWTDSLIYALRYGAGMDRVFSFGESKGIKLVTVSGSVTGASSGDKVKISHNNTEYQYTLDSNMTYSCPYVCPIIGEWKIGVYRSNSPLYEDTITPTLSDLGGITKNITIS